MKVNIFKWFSFAMVVMMILSPIGSRQAMAVDTASSAETIASPEKSGVEVVGVSETGIYIVKLTDASLATYKGGISGLAATSPEVTGARKLDAKSPASVAYLDYLAGKQADFIKSMQTALGRTVEVSFQYLNVFNGLAVYASQEEAGLLAKLPGVSAVYADTFREMETEIGPTLIGAPAIWNGNTSPNLASKGEGVIIGVIDSGINHDHDSFADIGDDLYNHTNPYGSGNYVGYCDTDDPTFCNDKLIGAYDLYDDAENDPEDTDGHGSHTSSTSGGNYVDVQVTPAMEVTISGVAPHANIIAYKICNPSCPGSSAIEAVDLAIADDVDVLNYSISGTDNPWLDPVDLAFLDAYGAGIFVSASAGNDGPGAGTVAKTGPWNASVAASTHSRVVANTLDVIDPPPGMTGFAAVPGENTVISTDFTDEITYDPANLDGCVAFDPGYFSDVIALIQRGSCTFATKVTNAAAAGAVAVVVFNNVGGPPITMGDLTGTPPAVMVDLNDGTAIKDYIDLNGTVIVTINSDLSYILKPEWEDIMAGFSSRGPSQFELLKPDYTAPGVNILAAVASDGIEPNQFGYYQGTSMAAPHGAGAAALMVGVYPSWSPSEIKSAMASTSDNTVLLDSDGATPADPYDMGSGRLDLNLAGNAGFVMGETFANYQAADPAIGGDPKTLNQPSMVDYDCRGTCSWTRTLTSVLPASQEWNVTTSAHPTATFTVEPANFILAAGGTQVITITADVSAGGLAETYFGDVYLEPVLTVLGDPAPAHLPIVVQVGATEPMIDVTPDSLESFVLPDGTNTELLTISNLGEMDLEWSLFDNGTPIGSPELVDWSDNFDSYATDLQLHGVGGWKGWANDPNAGAFTRDEQALSTPNSVEIVGASDLVHEYSGYDTGWWVYTAWQYVPSTFSGQSYFILLNTYNDGGVGLNWSTQVYADADLDLVVNAGATPGTLPLIYDQWVELRVEIDLVNDTQDFYYDGQLLYAGTWTDENSGGGALNIGAVDLFANGATAVYYDNISLVENAPEVCDMIGEIDWLSTDPTSGVTPGGGSSPVDVIFDAAGYTTGVYTATLCAESNDPVTPIVPIPVTMNVEDVLLTKEAPATANQGDVFTYTIDLDLSSPVHGYAWITDTLPAGVEYISDTVTASFGDAWYDPMDNAVYWSLGTPMQVAGSTAPTGSGSQVALMLDSEPVDVATDLSAVKIPDAAVDMVLDDGSPETVLGVGGTWEFLYLNRFTPDPSQFPFVLNEIWTAFVHPSVLVGDDLLLMVLQDDDNNPANGAQILATVPAEVQTVGAWNAYLLDTPVMFIDPGDVLIGIVALELPGVSYYPAALDTTTTQQRSWIGFWADSPPPDPITFPPDDGFDLADNFGFAGNWLIRGYGETIVIPQSITVTFQVEVTAHPGQEILNTAELDYDGDSFTADALTVVPQEFGVELMPAAAALAGDPAEVVEYTLVVTNTGNYTDTIDFSVAGNAWDVHFPVTSVDLASGASTEVLVHVTIPADAMAGEMDMATVIATAGDGSFAESELTTTANQVFGIELTPATDALSGAPGDVVTYTLTLTNTGNGEDTVALTLTGNLWDSELSALSFDLAAGEAVEVTVVVTIPADAENAEDDMVTVTATSEGSVEASSELTTTAVVEGPGLNTIVLPFVVKDY